MVEECRLSRIGVANEGDGVLALLFAAGAAQVAALLDFLEADFFDQLLPKMAEKGEWVQLEGYIELAGDATIETLMEIALERGDFDAVDLLDPYLS